MAGSTCTIGNTGFGALAGAKAGRYCLECYSENLTFAIRRFHCPGVQGNFIVRGNRNGGSIYARLRYVNSFPAIRGDYNTDRAAWENTAITITDENGAQFQNCNLQHMRPLYRPHYMGRGNGLCCMDVEAVFHMDG